MPKRLVVFALVWANGVVVIRVGVDQVAHVVFAQDQEVVRAFAPQQLYPPLRESIHVRRTDG